MMQEVSDIAENRPRDASAEEEGRRFEVVHVHRAGFDMREPAKVRGCRKWYIYTVELIYMYIME